MKLLCRLLVAAMLAGPVACFSQANPVRVGFIAPLSGPASDFGNSARLGVELAVEEINEVGGYLGRPIQLVVSDDEGKPEQGRMNAEKLVSTEHVAFTIGGGSSGVTLKELEVFQRSKQVLMVAMATATDITTRYPPAQSYIFRAAASDRLQADFLVDEVLKKGYSRVALFADNTGYGEAGANDVTRFLAEKGKAPVYVARFDVGVHSLAPNIAQAVAAGADVIISYTLGPEQALIARERAQARVGIPQYAPWTASSRVVWERAGNAANGIITVQTIIWDPSNERRFSFIARLNKHANGQPIASLMAAAQHYDAMHLMMRALFQAKGDTSGAALKAALEDLQKPYLGVITTHGKPFSASDHEAFTKNMTWLGVWRQGDIQFLYAADAKRASIMRRKGE